MRTKPLLGILPFAVATVLSGCASNHGVVHTTEFYDIVLSPQHRTDSKDRISLVSIGRSGRVTIRDSKGRLWWARQGESFTNTQGWVDDYRLKSVDRQSGRVVVEGEMRVYY